MQIIVICIELSKLYTYLKNFDVILNSAHKYADVCKAERMALPNSFTKIGQPESRISRASRLSVYRVVDINQNRNNKDKSTCPSTEYRFQLHQLDPLSIVKTVVFTSHRVFIVIYHQLAISFCPIKKTFINFGLRM